MAYKATLINLTQEQKTALRIKAGQLTSTSGQTVSVNDIIRQAIETYLGKTQDDDMPVSLKGHEIRFTPIPVVNKAIQRASSDSGKPVGDVVNTLLYEAIQAQAV